MSETNGHSRRYEISTSGQVDEEVRECAREAAASGRSLEFYALLGQILRRIEREADTCGEPSRTLVMIRLQLRRIMIGAVFVEYGVHEAEPIVFIRRVQWTGG